MLAIFPYQDLIYQWFTHAVLIETLLAACRMANSSTSSDSGRVTQILLSHVDRDNREQLFFNRANAYGLQHTLLAQQDDVYLHSLQLKR
jgi:hypothetical protein